MPVITLRALRKRFGSVVACDNISLPIHGGEVLALLGENGAGKTTLLNILSGMIRPDGGEILLDGRPVAITSPQSALAQGISTVYQHFTLVPTLSVIENLVLGRADGIRLALDDEAARLQERLDSFGLDVAPRTLVRHLSVGQRQRVEIVKALTRQPRVLLLDEPTSVLTPIEVETLLPVLRRLAGAGVAVVFITHKLEEALSVSDRIAILRAGRLVGTLEADDLRAGPDATRARIIELMFGRSEPAAAPVTLSPAPIDRRPALALRGLTARDDRGALALAGISLELPAGEIFGIAGVDGNGQKELGEVIAGQRRPVAGRVMIDGRDLAGRGVGAARRAGIGYVTDDRLGEGCVPQASVALNAVLKRIDRRPFSRRWLLDRRAITREATALIQRFDIRTPGAETPIARLSGGNIQKLLLARELAAEPRVLVCNKPTSGLDRRTAAHILSLLREAAAAGRAIILISAELDELTAVCDRIGVIYRGRLTAIFDRADFDARTMGHLMLGGAPAAARPAVA